MPSIRLTLIVCVALLSPAAVAPAQTAEAAAEAAARSGPTTSAVPLAEPRLERRLLSPMVAEMFDAMDEQRVQVRALKAELARTHEPALVFELQRRIALAKQAIELRLLRIQATHARREGRVEVARSLDAAILALTTPPEPREPAERPAPMREDVR